MFADPREAHVKSPFYVPLSGTFPKTENLLDYHVLLISVPRGPLVPQVCSTVQFAVSFPWVAQNNFILSDLK